MAQEEPEVPETEVPEDGAARILTDLVGRLQEAGGPITVVGAKVAASLGVPVAAFRSHIADLVAKGEIVKLSAGIHGTTLALPGMVAAPDPPAGAPRAEPDAPEPAPVDAPSADTQAEAGEPSPADDDGASTRQRIHDIIRAVVQAAHGEVTVTAHRLAEMAGTSAATVAYHVKQLVEAGHITTQSAGRMGMRIHLDDGSRTAGSTPRRRVRASAGSGATAGFCPWCGHVVRDRAWRFCQGCGERLAH